jgi:ribosomal protein S27E
MLTLRRVFDRRAGSGGMYTVVGCPECTALKIVDGRPETTNCPRCGRTSQFSKLRAFYRSEEVDAAREVRARLLAERSGHADAYEDLGTFADLDEDADTAGMSAEEFLERSGLDTDAVAAAGGRAESGEGGSMGRKETVETALRDLDRPTEAEVVDYAGERGIPADYVRSALDRLARRGRVTETNGRYRLL